LSNTWPGIAGSSAAPTCSWSIKERRQEKDLRSEGSARTGKASRRCETFARCSEAQDRKSAEIRRYRENEGDRGAEPAAARQIDLSAQPRVV
jgi:hypothetical protein